MDDSQLEALTGIRVTMLLADYATVTEGKLTVVGAGWTVTGPGPTPFAIAALLEIPWALTNMSHEFKLELLDADGDPVLSEDGEPNLVSGEFELGAPIGVRPGTSITLPIAVNNPAFLFPPDSTLEWRLSIDGRSRDDWRLTFQTRPQSEDPLY